MSGAGAGAGASTPINKTSMTTGASHRGIVLPRNSQRTSGTSRKAASPATSESVGAPPLFSVDSTPERHAVRESTSFVRRVNEWIAGESRRDAGLLRTLQGEHSRSGDAAWKAMIESEILAADEDVQFAATAFRTLDSDACRRSDDARADVDDWRRDFDRLMDDAAAGASSEYARVSEQLAAKASALRAQRAAALAAAAMEQQHALHLHVDADADERDFEPNVSRRGSMVDETNKEKPGAQDNDGDADADADDGDEFFEVDEDLWEKEPPQLRMIKK